MDSPVEPEGDIGAAEAGDTRRAGGRAAEESLRPGQEEVLSQRRMVLLQPARQRWGRRREQRHLLDRLIHPTLGHGQPGRGRVRGDDEPDADGRSCRGARDHARVDVRSVQQ